MQQAKSKLNFFPKIPQGVKRTIVGATIVALLYPGMAILPQIFSSNISYQTYSSEQLGLEIKHPKDWTVNESVAEENSKGVIFGKPADKNDTDDRQTSARLIVSIQESDESDALGAEEFFKSLEEANDKLGKPEGTDNSREYAELDSSHETRIDGNRALKVSINIKNYHDVPGDKGRAILLFIFVNPTKQISLIYESNESNDDIYDSFDEIAASMDIKS